MDWTWGRWAAPEELPWDPPPSSPEQTLQAKVG